MSHFAVPLTHSSVSGVTIATTLIPESIADNAPIKFISEYIHVHVEHDGSSPSVSEMPMYWTIYITASEGDDDLNLRPNNEPFSIGVCLKKIERLTGLIFHKKRHKGNVGYFLEIITNEGKKVMSRHLLLSLVTKLTLH